MFSLTILSSLFGGILSFIKKLFDFSTTNPKTFFIGLAIVILIGGTWYAVHKIDSLEAQNASLVSKNAALIADNKTLQDNLDASIAINKNNQIVINQLSQAKTDAEQRIQEMQNQVDQSNQTIANIQKMISNSSSAQDGPIAPVLANTINAIQSMEGN